MSKKMKFFFAALAAAWAVDLLFWKAALGINFGLWILLALVAGWIVARSEQVKAARLTWVLAAVALFLGLVPFIRSQPFTLFTSVVLSLACLFLLAATFRHANWPFYRLADYVGTAVKLVLALFSRPPGLLFNSKAVEPADSPAKKPASTWRRLLPVLRGVLLAIPILIIFTTLLATADPIFNDQVKSWLAWFDLKVLGETIFRFFYILILSYVFTGVYLHAIHPSKHENRPEPQKDWASRVVGWTETAIVLISVNLLFIVFVAIQFWYLFGGQANISTTQYTYAEYARRGFNELVSVAVLSLGLYLALSTITRLNKPAHQRWFSTLSIFLIAQVLVILASAFQRLLLYENAYGWTQLRTYTHIFIIWLAVLLLATIVLEITRRRHHFGLAGLVFVLGFGITLGLLNVDHFIARQNIQRARDGFELDARYLAELSSDAVPVLVEEFARPGQPAAVRDALGAELACRTTALQNAPQRDWRGSNLSESNARELLTTHQSSWTLYTVTGSGKKMTVTVNGQANTCLYGSRIFID